MRFRNHHLAQGLETSRKAPLATIFAGVLTAFIVLGGSTALEAQVGSAPVDGEIEYLFLDNPNDPWSAGSIVLANQTIIIPRNLLIDLPANRLTLQQLFEGAPPESLALGESGLALQDASRRGRGAGFGHVIANQMPDGTFVAGELFIQKGMEVFSGVVTFIDHTDGYIRCNGFPNDPLTGTMIRINDPEQVHTIQQGLGCDGGPNCSPDPRFTNDPSNYTVAYATGYPACLPSTEPRVNPVTGQTTQALPDGTGDSLCPTTNRPEFPQVLAQDSRFMAPIQLGDHITCEGNTEIVLDRTSGDLISFLSAHTFGVSRTLHTLDSPNQPDYIAFDEAEWDAPGFSNERSKSLFIAFTSLPASEFDVFALDTDPATGETHERILASTANNPLAQNHGIGPTGRNIGKVGYDVDFSTGQGVNPRVSPCFQLRTSGFDLCSPTPTLDEEFAIVVPLTREVIGRTRHKAMLAPGVQSYDIKGAESQNGEYLTPVGIGHPEFDEINLDALATPHIFVGQNWNLDRRLGPGGCLPDASGACDPADPIGTHRLDPFPLSELDALGQILTFPPANLNLVYDYFPLGTGNQLNLESLVNTMTIANSSPTPGWARGPDLFDACLSLNSAPVAIPDALTTPMDTVLVINSADLTANDSDPENDALTVDSIGTPGALGGTVLSTGPTTWEYTPPPGATGITDLLTYTISDAHGGSASGQFTVQIP